MSKKIFGAFSLVFVLLFSCNCGSNLGNNNTSTPLKTVKTETVQQEYYDTRNGDRIRSDHMKERTVYIERDCDPKEKTVVIGSDSPETEFDGWGSGIIVRSTSGVSLVFTSAHVVQSNKKDIREAFDCSIKLKKNSDLQEDNYIKAKIVSIDHDKDIAVIKVEESLGYSTSLVKEPILGETVWAVGFPVQMASRSTKRLSITSGTLATINVPAGGSFIKYGYFHRVTSQIYFGNSGGGVWTRDGKLLCIVAALFVSKGGAPIEGYYYCKPVSEYTRMLSKDGEYESLFD